MTLDRQHSVGDKANHVAESFKSQNPGALHELHHDLQGMSSGQRKEFFHKLQGAANGQKLPGLEISEDSKHHLKVSESVGGKSHTLYDESAKEHGRHSDKPAKAAPDATQPKPDATQPKPDATQPNKDGEFSGGLRKGEGPYQALKRQHPDWDSKHLLTEARNVEKQLGRNSFKQGEQFKTNSDGSVSTKTTGADGNYSSETRKDGKVTETRTGDAAGNFQSQSFDANGKKLGGVDHKVNSDGYTETNTDGDGKVTSTVSADKTGTATESFDANGKKISSIRDNNDGSQVGWHDNADGSRTNIDQTDANHRTEITNFKDGSKVTKTTEQNADGKKVTTTDGKGTNTDVYDSTGNQTSAMRENNDGSAVGWRKNSDGSTTSIDQSDKNHRTETTARDGKTVSVMTHEQTDNGSKDVTTDAAGNTLTKTYDAKGTQTSGVQANKDGSSTGWSKDKNGFVTHSDTDTNGRESSMTFDSTGHLKKTEWHDKTGAYESQAQIGDYIRTTGMKNTQFGGLGSYQRMELGTLKGPDA
jgi:hypothetical protein